MSAFWFIWWIIVAYTIKWYFVTRIWYNRSSRTSIRRPGLIISGNIERSTCLPRFDIKLTGRVTICYEILYSHHTVFFSKFNTPLLCCIWWIRFTMSKFVFTSAIFFCCCPNKIKWWCWIRCRWRIWNWCSPKLTTISAIPLVFLRATCTLTTNHTRIVSLCFFNVAKPVRISYLTAAHASTPFGAIVWSTRCTVTFVLNNASVDTLLMWTFAWISRYICRWISRFICWRDTTKLSVTNETIATKWWAIFPTTAFLSCSM